MKKLIVVIFGCMFALATWGQTKFTVPAPTDLQKYQTAAWQWHGAYIIMISYAKSMGQSVEEAGSAAGEMALLTWSKETEFDGFVNSVLRSFVIMTVTGKVEIINQAEDKIEFMVTGFYKSMEDALRLYSITPAELSLFYKSYVSRMAEAFSINYTVKDTEDGMIVTISKK